MLAAARTPYLHQDLSFQTPPRVISEIKKQTPAWPRDNVRPRITGELLCHIPPEGRWRMRRVAVRSGQLLVGSPGDQCPRLALRRLNLTPGSVSHSFALRRSPDTQPLLTLQASNQREFDNWVRTIAIELIRQTPLEAIKYLDIFTLTPQMSTTQKPEVIEKDCNHNCLTSLAPITIREQDKKNHKLQESTTHLDENRNHCQARRSKVENTRTNSLPNNVTKIIIDQRNITNLICKPLFEQDDEQTVEILLKKCQNSDSYVPVKEKLKLFESLCRLGRITNNEEISTNQSKYSTKRTRSLHDLSHSENNLPNNAGVKQICKYFETKNDANRTTDTTKYNTIARIHRTSCGPVKTMIGRKYSVQSIKH